MSGSARVLQVLQPEDGGVAEHVLLLARGLDARGWQVEVACPESSSIRPALEDEGIATHPLALDRGPGAADLRVVRRLRQLDRRGGNPIVHAHSSKAGVLVRAALPDRRRLVYTPHCFAFAMADARAALLYRAIEQALTPRTGAIVAVAEWERRLAARTLRGAHSRLHLVPNGIARQPGSEPDRALVEFAAGRPIAGFVGVLRPQKDPLGLVRAGAEIASRSDPPACVAIVGNGWLEAEVRTEIARLGVADAVRWFPFEGDAGRYLAALDVFVLPSRWEALPLAPIEALSCGVPVVATNVGGVPEIVDHGVTGVLVEPGRPDRLAAAIEALLADADRRLEMGERGRRTARERFDVERMVDATEAIYRGLLRGRRAAAPTPAGGA